MADLRQSYLFTIARLGLDVPACNFFSVQCVLIGVRFAIKWTNIEKPYMQRKWFYYNKAIPKRKCFFILDLRKSDGTLCKQDSGAGSSLWSLRSASWEHCSTLVQHILDWQHILMGTTTLPSFSALLVWFFSFSAHLSSATIAWRLLGKKSVTHRTRPWAHAGVAESHWSNQCHWESKSQGHGTGCYNSNKTLTMQTCNQKSEISRYDMVSSGIIVATCHDSVSSHLMSFVCNYGIMVRFFFTLTPTH